MMNVSYTEVPVFVTKRTCRVTKGNGDMGRLDRYLLDKKDAQRKQELLKAVENSSRTFDEIMAFLKAEE